VARGEGGEQLMLELVAALESGGPFDDIRACRSSATAWPCTTRRAASAPCSTTCRSPTSSLIQGYEQHQDDADHDELGLPLPLQLLLGHGMFGRKYRFRSAENIIAELKQRKPRKIFFYDDNIAADKKRLKELCQRMLDEDIVVPWSAQMRTDVVRDPELLDLMHRSGCFRAYLGLESVNQATSTPSTSTRASTTSCRPSAFSMSTASSRTACSCWAPTPTPSSRCAETVKFAMKNHIDTIQLAALTPLPGTPLFDELNAAGASSKRTGTSTTPSTWCSSPRT